MSPQLASPTPPEPDPRLPRLASFVGDAEQPSTNPPLSQAPRPTILNGDFEEELAIFGVRLQSSLVLNEVATIAANEGRILLGCDRVSVIIERGGNSEVRAISGQESIHRRSNLVQSMIRLSREVIRSGVAVKYAGTTDSLAPQVKERLADFLEESGARMVYLIPLRAPEPIADRDETDKRPDRKRRVFGCLLFEQFSNSEPAVTLTRRLDWLTIFSAAALHNALTHQSLFLLPVWRALGSAADLIRGRMLLKTLLVLAIVSAIVCGLIFIPSDFRIEADGRLMPVVRREIFVPYDSEVVEVLVASGERVTQGQSLIRLRNNELRFELIATESQREEKRNLLNGLIAERDASIALTGDRGNRIEGELAKVAAELRGIERRIQVLQERERSLNVISPITGVVSTFEIDQLLKHRPVRRGEILLEVMDDVGPWHLELNVAEHRIGHLLRSQQDSKSPLLIDYLLVTAPEWTCQATLKEVGTRVMTSDDNREVVEVLASPEESHELTRRIGAEVRARIHCGRKSIGYRLFGDVIEFVRRYFWL